MAEMNGWETRNFPSISVEHRRITGSYFGIVRGCFESGKFLARSFFIHSRQLFITPNNLLSVSNSSDPECKSLQKASRCIPFSL